MSQDYDLFFLGDDNEDDPWDDVCSFVTFLTVLAILFGVPAWLIFG